jgi:tetratricopeptide (TPR) repeat protein
MAALAAATMAVLAPMPPAAPATAQAASRPSAPLTRAFPLGHRKLDTTPARGSAGSIRAPHAPAAVDTGDAHAPWEILAGAVLAVLFAFAGALAAQRRAGRRPTASLVFATAHPRREAVRSASGASELGSANAAYKLGALLHRRQDRDGAAAAYRLAAQRGHAQALLSLGTLYLEADDAEGAEHAWHEADAREHPLAAARLGRLLLDRGDLRGALAACRRANERGDARGAAQLERLIARAPLDLWVRPAHRMTDR